MTDVPETAPAESAWVTVHRGDIVAVDLDNVAFQFVERVLDIWRREHPDIALPELEEVQNYTIGHGLAAEQQAQIRKIWHRPGFFRTLEPMPGVVEAINEMRAEQVTIIFCSVPSVSEPETTCHGNKIDRLREVFGSWAAESCVLTSDKTIVRADLLLDDKPLVQGLCSPFWQHAYYDRPWNRPKNMDAHRVPRRGRGIARLHRWQDWRQTIRISSSR